MKDEQDSLRTKIEDAIAKYKEAGGSPEFYIVSKSDHDRNWANAIRETENRLIEKFEEIIGEDEVVTGYSKPDGRVSVDLTASYNNEFRAKLRGRLKDVQR